MSDYWYNHQTRRGQHTLEQLLPIINGRGYIAGSYAAFCASPMSEPIMPNDIDVFATTTKNALDVANELSEHRKTMVYLTNSKPDVYSVLGENGDLPIQVIEPSPNWKKFPDDLLNDFDLDISRAVVLSVNEILADNNVGHLTGKILRINNPLRTLKRVIKYSARKAEFNDWELLKLFRAWEEMPKERKDAMIKSAEEEFNSPVPDSGFWDGEDTWFEGENIW